METNKHFNNKDGAKKQIARVKIASAILNSNVFDKEIPSLPFHTCEIERMLLRKNSGLKFLGCEINPKVYWKMFATIGKKKLPITPYYGFLSDKIKTATENQYSHIIADYCGQFNSHHEELEIAMRNKIVQVGGTISLTFSTRIGYGASEIYDLMEDIAPVKRGMNKTEHAIRTFVKAYGRKKYVVETVFNYKDTSPMILVIIKRIA